jgi:hypothetical protein
MNPYKVTLTCEGLLSNIGRFENNYGVSNAGMCSRFRRSALTEKIIQVVRFQKQ